MSVDNLYRDQLIRRLESNGDSLGLFLAVNACIYEIRACGGKNVSCQYL